MTSDPMTLPSLAAKAREIAEDCLGHHDSRLDDLAADILSALTEADAAATERAAKVVEAKWGRFGPRATDALAAAIRNQEPTDADA